jgi:hypothetical protein
MNGEGIHRTYVLSYTSNLTRKIYYHDPDRKYPGTKEKPGYWLGVTDHVGDRLCFHILTTGIQRIIKRSAICSDERSPMNATLTFPLDDMHPNPLDVDDPDNTIISVEYDVNNEIVPDERGETENINDTVT